jgi:hypothetical protein
MGRGFLRSRRCGRLANAKTARKRSRANVPGECAGATLASGARVWPPSPSAPRGDPSVLEQWLLACAGRGSRRGQRRGRRGAWLEWRAPISLDADCWSSGTSRRKPLSVPGSVYGQNEALGDGYATHLCCTRM